MRGGGEGGREIVTQWGLKWGLKWWLEKLKWGIKSLIARSEITKGAGERRGLGTGRVIKVDMVKN